MIDFSVLIIIAAAILIKLIFYFIRQLDEWEVIKRYSEIEKKEKSKKRKN